MKSVMLAPYTATWPQQFERTRGELAALFPLGSAQIEHIGSTAVPSLAAKPVIDIMLGTPSLALIEAKRAELEALGFEYVSKYERELPMRRYFVRPAGAMPRVHLHCVVVGSAFWTEHLAFRDALRKDVMLREQYQALKQELAAQFPEDSAAYTAAKAPFIQAVLRI